MKKLYLLFLAGSLTFGVSTIAKAQPRERQTETAPQRNIFPADVTISNFIFYFKSGSLNFAADVVDGADKSNPNLRGIADDIRGAFSHINLRVTDIKVTPDPTNPDIAKATYTLILRNNILDFDMRKSEIVTLKKHIFKQDERWLIVPGSPEKDTFFTGYTPFLNTQNQPSSNIVRHFAAMIAYPEKALPKIQLRQSMEQLKHLGLALMQFLQDHDERFDFDEQNFKEKLTPYLKDTSDFIAPGDSTLSYDINPNIVGLQLVDIPLPSETVAFYLGHDEKLDFRYDGLSPVCFTDGHVKAINKEQVKDLQWQR